METTSGSTPEPRRAEEGQEGRQLDSRLGTGSPSGSGSRMVSLFCETCNEEVEGEEAVSSHLQLETHRRQFLHEGPSLKELKLYCKICNLRFSGPEPLKDHLNSKNHKKKAQLGISSLPHNRQNWSCQVCQVVCSGPEPFKQHLDSRGHQRELRKKEILEENGILTPPPTTTLSPDSSSPHICHLCQVSFPQFNLLCQHMESLSHKMAMRKHNPMAQAEEDGLQTLTGDDQVDKNVEEELPLVIHPAGQASEEEPAISVTEYCLQGTETNIHPSVANIPVDLSSAQGYYTCKTCNIQVTGLIPYQHHMDGAKHQKKFMQVSQSKSSSQDIYERKLKIAELIKTFESDDDETGSEKIGTSICCTTCHNEAHEDIQALVEHYNSTPHALTILDKQLSQDIGENWRESEALIHYFRDKFDNQE